MDASARERVSAVERAGTITAGLAADIMINYPLWIIAKRTSAGLTFPPLGELYKGGGGLLCSQGPMIVTQDASTAMCLRFTDGRLSPDASLCASSCFSGAVGALLVGAQMEAVITRAHSTHVSVVQAARNAYGAGGVLALLAPYGALMMACREVPFAGCLFFLSGYVRARLEALFPDGGVPRDMAAAAVTASVAGPLSHAPNVVAAHQQANLTPLGETVRSIYARAGLRGFVAGLLPRTASLAGTLFVFPFTVERVQAKLEGWRK